MSECKKCGVELVCDVPFFTKLKSGKAIKGHRSAPHGCPPEYDHYVWPISKEETDAWFSAVTAEDE